MVLTQPKDDDYNYSGSYILFPYHYGSYATFEMNLLLPSAVLTSFHTTMVLTQPA